MTSLLLIALAIVVGIAVFQLHAQLIAAPKRRREAEAAPRITMEEIQNFWSPVEAASLPMASAKVEDRPPANSLESRIGGCPAILDGQEDWPSGSFDGSPMYFVAQINFAEIAELPDFPSEGVLQVFSSFDIVGEEGEAECIIRWSAKPTDQGVLAVPELISANSRNTRDFSETARRVGLPLTFKLKTVQGNPYNWPFNLQDGVFFENRLPQNQKVGKLIDDFELRSERIVEAYETHWVGGHPHFVQEDIRHSPKCQQLDRVLLHIGCDKDINLGDSGMANVMISREALLERDFQKAILTWDCS